MATMPSPRGSLPNFVLCLGLAVAARASCFLCVRLFCVRVVCCCMLRVRISHGGGSRGGELAIKVGYFLGQIC